MEFLKYPYPFKAWFTISNDPDFTNIEDWRELDEFIWKELELPLSNSLFVKSLNHNLPQQVNLVDHPEIKDQLHDTIHTWGDYMHSRKIAFDRSEAEEAVRILGQEGISPKVWVDHSKFIGNVLHHSELGAIPKTEDASGHVYQNFNYTLDLIRGLGIRYIWNGGITDIIGQNRQVKPSTYFKNHSSSTGKYLARYTLNKALSPTLQKKFKVVIPDNNLVYPHTFPDGSEFYLFRRYGKWHDADIYGLGNIIAPEHIDELLEVEGSMIAYTHLGKRPADKMNEPKHIPEKTRRALAYIAELYNNKRLKVSSLSQLLDYTILHQYMKYDRKSNTLFLQPDGIRYKSIHQENLKLHTFSFKASNSKTLESLTVRTGDTDLSFQVHRETGNTYTISFP